MKQIICFLIGIALANYVQAGTQGDSLKTQGQTLSGGFRFQKAAGFYWTNGISLEYKTAKIWKQKISLGLNFLSSRLGSAMVSNAIPYYEVDLSAIKYFRGEKRIKPLLRLNVGYAHANYGSDIFDDLPRQSMLASFEAGAAYDLKCPLRITLSGGYNFIYGNGSSGLGVLFPAYAQLSVFYRMSR